MTYTALYGLYGYGFLRTQWAKIGKGVRLKTDIEICDKTRTRDSLSSTGNYATDE